MSQPITRRARLTLDGGYDRDQVEACEYHPDHRWTVQRIGDVLGEDRPNADGFMCFCIGCFVPRCGHTTDPDPCMLPRHHNGPHYEPGGEALIERVFALLTEAFEGLDDDPFALTDDDVDTICDEDDGDG